jgi:TatA/E family protein of Tat protein translocase
VDILGIGPLELVLILVVALLVFGPDKLPEIGAKMGKGVRELRQLSREITQGVNTIVEPVDELRKPFDDAAQVVHQVTDTAESLRNPGRTLQNALNQQLTTAGAPPIEKENTIAPPQPQAPGEPAGAQQAVSDAPDLPDEAAAPPAQPSDISPPIIAADPTTMESPSQASEH